MSPKITSPEALNALRDRARADIDLRSGPKELSLTVHMGTCGIAAGARDILTQLADELGDAPVTLRRSGCLGLCDQEPMLTLTDKSGHEYVYGRLDRRKLREIVREHVLGGHPLVEYLVKPQGGERTYGQR